MVSRFWLLRGIITHDLIDTHAQQDVNLDRLFADVSVYNTRVMGPAHVENVVEPDSTLGCSRKACRKRFTGFLDLACRTALGYRGVAHINFPVDLQDQEVASVQSATLPTTLLTFLRVEHDSQPKTTLSKARQF
jgi:pyruvate dehydrogenase (quinone)